MQELKFEQVDVVSGGFQGLTGPEDLIRVFNQVDGGNGVNGGCIIVSGESLSPSTQALFAGVAAAASRLHISVAVGVAALASYFNAYVQQDQVSCPHSFSEEELAEIIDKGLKSGGPL